ncbi:MAG: bifunctional metallophosphatase/5'-nucleotidase [Alistipes sp.]|nr:bifunctional metallophosphatase/5'-nucleotidase [Alistipes sp.]
MKKVLYTLCLLACLTPAGYALYNRYFAERTVVILSTNDIHAAIDNFPRLATAVERCRDTVACILVDAGDRWTGSAYVDLAPEPRKPIITLMNRLGFEVATFGNHEFDSGREFLRDMLDEYRFEIVCANVRAAEEGKFPHIPAYTIKNVGGLRIGFAGVVTNFQNGHPEGNEAGFEGLEFPDAFDSAEAAVREMKPHCDVSAVISHMGCKFDTLLLNRVTDFDLMISGHTHLMLAGEVNGTLVGQTKKALTAVGVTTIRARGRKILDIDYRNVMLADYPCDPEFQAMVDEIKSDPYLNEMVGFNAEALDLYGLADMHSSLIKRATGSEVGFYHKGGIRLSELPADSVSRATIINSDIFVSHVYTIVMTPEQMRKMILTKYNDDGNINESHRIDLFCTEPYTIVTDASDRALNVKFPTLKEGRGYKTAICSYVFENYRGIEGSDAEYYKEPTIPEIFMDYFVNNSPAVFSNAVKQHVIRE